MNRKRRGSGSEIETAEMSEETRPGDRRKYRSTEGAECAALFRPTLADRTGTDVAAFLLERHNYA
jgi:hypothetical protein